jgi:drug/metabolite transporter (DMT)-like permease
MVATIYANLTTAIVFLVFVPWGSESILPAKWTPSLALAGWFICGQFLTVFALKSGHASVSTPAMGSKVVMVALLAFALGGSVGINIWIGAVLTTIGIVVLAWPTEHLPLRPALKGIILSVLAAFCYAMFDTLTQRYSQQPGLSFGQILPPAMIIASVVSSVIVLMITRQRPRIVKGTGKHLLVGVLLMSIQSVLIISSIGYFGEAARMNVVYGSRGVWSVLLVWMLGHYFSHTETRQHLPRIVFVRRLVGATLIGAAVVLVVLG